MPRTNNCQSRCEVAFTSVFHMSCLYEVRAKSGQVESVHTLKKGIFALSDLTLILYLQALFKVISYPYINEVCGTLDQGERS